MTGNGLPSAFVWTKIQADSGERIEGILYRKEIERQAGDGVFWWGIGESKRQAIDLLLKKEPSPAVLFSLMRSRPHPRDSNPDGVLLWNTYLTGKRELPLPPHVIVTSRAHAKDGRPKSRYHALVCKSRSSILRKKGGTLDAGTLRNIGERGRPVGPSQVTAAVELSEPTGTSMQYEITARATLASPYVAALSCPRELSAAERRLLRELAKEAHGRDDWNTVARRLRRM